MPDPLRAQIAAALARPLSGDEFERCAVRLLRQFHPSLLPVAGGNDAGLDGSGGDANGEFGLVATVGQDASANLRRNLKSHLDAGGPVRRVIFATSRVLSGRRQVNLGRAAAELGFELMHVYDGAQLAELLYRDSECRADLLGLAGGLSVLSSYPLSRRASVQVELLGRADVLQELQQTTRDVVIIGKPGIGKTSVVQNLVGQGWGLFDVGSSTNNVAEAARAMEPYRIIVEDAHFSVQRLVELRHLRDEAGLHFGIVATTWPGSRSEVASALPGASVVEVAELTRAEILTLIQNLGIKGPRELQREIVRQALGRPGLATTLAMAAINGKLLDVATGEVLLEDIVEWCHRTLGQDSHQLLGVIALSGDHGITVEQCARYFSVTPIQMSDRLKALASGGILDETFHLGQRTRYLRVQPDALRYLLVKGVFSGTAAPDWRPVASVLDSAAQALIPLIGARIRGASVTTRDLTDILSDQAGVREVQAFASLGPDEAHLALERFPDRKLEVALVALSVDFPFALHALMELAIGDDRSQGSHPGHPLRGISEFLRNPTVAIEQRAEAIQITKRWLDSGGDARVGLEVLSAAVHPAISDIYSDPGEGHTITLVEGIYLPEDLRRIAGLWDEVLNVIEGKSFPTYEALFSALHNWVFPHVAQLGGSVDEERRQIARTAASHVVDRLSRSWAGSPGPLSALRDLSRRGRLQVAAIEVSAEFDTLFPERDIGEDLPLQDAELIDRLKDQEAEMIESVKDLGRRWLSLGPQDLANQISFAEDQANKIGRTWPRFTPQLCEHLAARYSSVAALLHELDSREVPPDLLAPLLLQLTKERASGWDDEIRVHLENPRTRFVTVHICLNQAVGAELQRTAIGLMNGGYRNLIEMLAIRRQLDESAIRSLLSHPDAEVSKDTAVAVWRDRPAELSQETLTICRATLVKADGDHNDFWLWHALKTDPSLLEDWTREWIARNVSANGSFLPHEAMDAIRALPLPARLRLLEAVPDSTRNFFWGDLISALVGNAEETVELLFSRPSLVDYGRNALAGFPDEAWAKKAVIAHQSGMSPDEVAGACLAGMSSWRGNESEHWDQYVDAFERLRGEPDLKAIADAGAGRFSRMRDEARARERREAIFGFDHGDR